MSENPMVFVAGYRFVFWQCVYICVSGAFIRSSCSWYVSFVCGFVPVPDSHLGAAEDMAHSSLRFGIGRFTTEAEIDFVVNHIVRVVTRLRDMRYGLIRISVLLLCSSLPSARCGRWCRKALTSTRLTGLNINLYFWICDSGATFCFTCR
jgi:hypothetical protein